MTRACRIACGFLLAALLWHGPARAQLPVPLTSCMRAATYDASTSGLTQLIAAGNGIYLCGFQFFAGGIATVKLVYGTGTNCGTGTVSLTPGFPLVAQSGFVDSSSYFRGLYVPPSNALCLNSSAAVAVQAVVYYWQQSP
jgi:hypothetical protein